MMIKTQPCHHDELLQVEININYAQPKLEL